MGTEGVQMKARRRRVAAILTIAVFSIAPSSTASMTPIPRDSTAHVRGGGSPRPVSIASSPNPDDSTREEKTIALLILLLKQGRGVR